MVEQRIVEALAAHGNHTNSGTGGEGSQGNEKGAQIECTYKDFMNCKGRMFYGNKEVVGLTRWIEKTESIFEINSCVKKSKVKFAACMFADAAMSWWNGHVKTLGLANAYALSLEQLKQIIIEKYCP